jgi:hypothetical protein
LLTTPWACLHPHQSKDLGERTAALSKEAKALDSKYRTAHTRFERAYQQAAASCAHIMEQGGAPPKVDPRVVYKKHGLAKLNHQSSMPSPGATSNCMA